MNSKEIARRLRSENERKNKLISDTKTAILKLWEAFWTDDDNTEAKKRLNEIADQYSLHIWLEADAKEALKRSRLQRMIEIEDIIGDLPVNLDSCIADARIRLDFASALRGVKKGSSLSSKLGWGFAPDDLMNLMALHKSNKFRKKIEDLLTDCNFHTECGLLAERKYDEFERYVMSRD